MARALVTLLSDKTFTFSPECCYIPLSLAYKEQKISQSTNFNKVFNRAFHLSELTGQDIPFVMRILLLIKAIQPDQSNAK